MRDSSNGEGSILAGNAERNETRKRKRCYHRIISGVERGGELRFLTLTSTPDSPDIQRSWRRLLMRLRRRNLVQGYVKVTEYTKSGLPHLHVLYRGSYIDQVYLARLWEEIHGASIVDIRRAYGFRKLAGYLVKYMVKELARYSWSHDWVFKGFVGVWQAFKRSAFRVPEMYRDKAFDFMYSLWRGVVRGVQDAKVALGFLDALRYNLVHGIRHDRSAIRSMSPAR